MGVYKNTDNKYETQLNNREANKHGRVEPNLSDVDAMLRLHGVRGGDDSGEFWQNGQSYEGEPMNNFTAKELKQLYDPNSAEKLLDNSVSKPQDSIQSSARRIRQVIPHTTRANAAKS